MRCHGVRSVIASAFPMTPRVSIKEFGLEKKDVMLATHER